MSAINDLAWRETARLALYANVALWGAALCEGMQSFVEYALTPTNNQLKSRREGETVATIPTSCTEAMRLPEAVGWKAAAIKEINSLNDIGVHTFDKFRNRRCPQV